MRLSAPLTSFLVYGLAIVLMKGFSLVTIPLLAWKLPPADFGELDLVTSLVEFAALFSALGLSELLYRFCADDTGEAKTNAAALAGTAAIAIAVIMVSLQALAAPLHAFAELGVTQAAFRLALAGAAVTALIETPLAWLRLRNRPLAFLGFIFARAVAQIALVWTALALGFGASGVLIANALVDIVLATLLAGTFLRANGMAVSRAMTARLAVYGMPIVLSGLCMFALGAADRWFIAGHVSRADMAQYAIAAKLALATALVIQPFGLWWYPRRLALLSRPGGKAENAAAWLAGFAILSGGAVAIHLAMPAFVRLALPQAYAASLQWLPWLIAAIVLNELVSLSNAGAYLGGNTFRVLAVNAAAAILAIALYALLIPQHGLAGAIAATLAAHLLRLVSFIALSRGNAPVPVTSPATALILLGALLPALILPGDAGIALALAGATAAPLLAMAGLAAARPDLLHLARFHVRRA